MGNEPSNGGNNEATQNVKEWVPSPRDEYRSKKAADMGFVNQYVTPDGHIHIENNDFQGIEIVPDEDGRIIIPDRYLKVFKYLPEVFKNQKYVYDPDDIEDIGLYEPGDKVPLFYISMSITSDSDYLGQMVRNSVMKMDANSGKKLSNDPRINGPMNETHGHDGGPVGIANVGEKMGGIASSNMYRKNTQAKNPELVEIYDEIVSGKYF